MRVTLRLDGVTPPVLRAVLTAASRNRVGFPDYNHGGITGAEPWMPLVACEGPDCFTIILPPCDVATAQLLIWEAQTTATALEECNAPLQVISLVTA